jgi:hypothetical protein
MSRSVVKLTADAAQAVAEYGHARRIRARLDREHASLKAVGGDSRVVEATLHRAREDERRALNDLDATLIGDE